MDPKATLMVAMDREATVSERRQARKDYAAWVTRGGFKAKVEIHPACGLWMRGMKWAEVDSIGPSTVRVSRADFGGRTHGVSFDYVSA
jgi:hypothetical protein